MSSHDSYAIAVHLSLEQVHAILKDFPGFVRGEYNFVHVLHTLVHEGIIHGYYEPNWRRADVCVTFSNTTQYVAFTLRYA